MTNADEPHVEIFRAVLRDLTPQLLNCLPDDRPRRTICYLHGLSDRIGQISFEPFYLKSLFPPESHSIIIVLFDRLFRRARAEFPEVVEMALSETHPMPLPDTDLLEPINNMLDQDLGAEFDPAQDTWYLLHGSGTLMRRFFEHLANGGRPRYSSLRPEHMDSGKTLFSDLNIPDGAPLVTLHVRESGYLGHREDQDFRDADIMTYLPAVEFLLAQGFWVIRIGDPTMKAMPNLGARLIDGAHLSPRRSILDPYAIARSRFMINTASGPWTLAQALGTPSLMVNHVLYPSIMPVSRDMFAPKLYRDGDSGRVRSFSRIFRCGAEEFSTAVEYRNAGIHLEPIKADLLRDIVAEKLELESGGRTNPPPPELHALFEKQHNLARERNAAGQGGLGYFGMSLPDTRLPACYLKAFPELLEDADHVG